MGRLVFGFSNYPSDPQNALNITIAASAFKHKIYGDFNLVSITDVEKLMKGDGSG
jgi:2-dehydro-3-deoxygluconokinase